MKLLRDLIEIHSPSGEEFRMKAFLLDYVRKNQVKWRVQPEIFEGDELYGGLILSFGKPRTAIFAHMDTVGFTVRYQDQLVPIGGPSFDENYRLVGNDFLGPIECGIKEKSGHLFYDFPRAIATGTSLVFKPELEVSEEWITGPGLDNRLGIYNALKVAETLENGLLVFGGYEEIGGGSVPVLLDFIQKYKPVKQALISDITWATEGVQHAKGVAISIRDRNVPPRNFVEKLISLADHSGIKYQLEVEGSGSSDGREVHHSPYALDWCFVGAPESNIHSPEERVHTSDLEAMINLYKYFMEQL